MIDPASTRMVLGTALWGWTISRKTAFQLMDQYYDAGGRQLDCATNYPIDGNETHWRQAEYWLEEWLNAHGVQDAQLIMKVGSVNNLGGSESNLNPSCLLIHVEEYTHRFGDNLDTLSVHWDNRDDVEAIAATVEILTNGDWQPGLSGIKHPECYAAAGVYPWRIQVKHNLLQSALEHYLPHFSAPRFIAYGINSGGLKMDGKYRSDSSLRVRGGIPDDIAQKEKWQSLLKTRHSTLPGPKNLYHLGMLHAIYHPLIESIIIGPSRQEQLEDALQWFEYLQAEDHTALYQQLIS